MSDTKVQPVYNADGSITMPATNAKGDPIIGSDAVFPQFRDPTYDQSASMPNRGKGDLNTVPVAPSPSRSPFANVRSGRK